MNIQEDYVSFETAKLLKEKGFNEEDSPFYFEQDRDEWIQNNSYSIPNPNYNENIPFDSETLTMVAPHISFQKAMKWLREVHHYYIQIMLDSWACGGHLGYYVVLQKTDSEFEMILQDALDNVFYNTYEDACDAAIKYCLEHLIHIAKKSK